MKFSYFILFVTLLYPTIILHGQSINDVWYFGQNAGITFSTTPPTALTNGALNTDEGCATICDNTGQLLFYTDGMTLYNRNHIIMPNGTGLFGDISSTQSAIIIPMPGSSTIYYVFTLDAFAGAHGVCYSIVDITLDSGYGDVTTKNQTVLTPASEKITVVKHANNIDFWVVIHGWGNNTFYSYLLTPAGLNTTPVTSSVGTVYSGGGGSNNAANAIGYMKVNNAGNMIALGICIADVRELLQFNNSTGVLSNPITISDPDNTSTSVAYAMEFSPDNHYLYIKNFYSHNVYQYDVSNYNQTAIENSKTLVGTVSGASIYFTGAMQLGPDNKIYITQYDTPSLAVINFPNNPASTCGLVDNAIPLNGRNGRLGLPTLVNTSFIINPVFVSASGCFDQIYAFSISDTSNIISANWNFDDPASGVNNNSNLFSPTHLFTDTGSFNVSVIIVYNGGFTDTLYYPVAVSPAPDIIADDTVSICSGTVYQPIVTGVWNSYLWSTASTASTISITQQGMYSVTVTDINGCQVLDSLYCQVNSSTNITIDTSFCDGSSIDFGGQNISNPGSYVFNYITVAGCDSIITLNVETHEPPYVLLPKDTFICIGSQFVLTPCITGDYNSALWNDGYTSLTRTVTVGGNYVIIVQGNCGTTQDDINIEERDCNSEIWFPNVFTPNGDNHNAYFTASGIMILRFHIMIFNRWGQLLYETENITPGWDGNFKGRECPAGVYFWIADYSLYRNNIIVDEEAKGSVTLFR